MNSIFTPFPDTLWVRKEIKFGYSCSLCQILHSWYRQSSFLHSAVPRARDGMSISLMQDLAEKTLVPKLDSYSTYKNRCIFVEQQLLIISIVLLLQSIAIVGQVNSHTSSYQLNNSFSSYLTPWKLWNLKTEVEAWHMFLLKLIFWMCTHFIVLLLLQWMDICTLCADIRKNLYGERKKNIVGALVLYI